MLIKQGSLEEVLTFWPGSLVNLSTRNNGKHIRIERKLAEGSEVFIGKLLFLNPFAYGNFSVSAKIIDFFQNQNHFTLISELEPKLLAEDVLLQFSDNICLSKIFVGVSVKNLFFINYTSILLNGTMH